MAEILPIRRKTLSNPIATENTILKDNDTLSNHSLIILEKNIYADSLRYSYLPYLVWLGPMISKRRWNISGGSRNFKTGGAVPAR